MGEEGYPPPEEEAELWELEGGALLARDGGWLYDFSPGEQLVGRPSPPVGMQMACLVNIRARFIMKRPIGWPWVGMAFPSCRSSMLVYDLRPE